MIKLKNKNVLVRGLGVSGISATKLLCKKGANVWVWDDKVKQCDELSGLNVTIVKNKKLIPSFIDFTVISPGIKPKGGEVGELELGSWFVKKPIIAVTGTNGKTTVVQGLAKIFKTVPVGNVGVPISDYVNGRVVCEVSSFQLETIKTFHPRIAVILNVSQDHLDRHKTMKEYIRVKGKIFENQTKRDYLILNYDCEVARQYESKSKILFYSTKQKVNGIYVQGNDVILKNKTICKVNDLNAVGDHNLSNFLAILLTASLCGLTPKRILDRFKGFKIDANRLELVSTINGVQFYNDSKATNIASSLAGAGSFSDKNVHLIIGGQTKGQRFNNFLKLLPANIKSVVVIGEARLLFDNLPKAENLEQAVRMCFKKAEDGDVVLLSPACASFDMFQNYAHRGEVFRNVCYEISQEEKSKN